MDQYPPKTEQKQSPTGRTAASKERLLVFLTAIGFAVAMGVVLVESIVWYRSQVAALLRGIQGDWQAGAVLLALYASFAKKQVALMIAAVLALLGLGLSLHAMKQGTQAELSGAAGMRLNFSSYSPGIAAFLAAALIVLFVVGKNDTFETGAPIAESTPHADQAEKESAIPSSPQKK